MIQLFPNRADDASNATSMPPTDKTELNYRPRPLSHDEERRLTGLLMVFFGADCGARSITAFHD